MFDRYQLDHDRAARDALFERFLPLALHLARRYRGAGGHAEDLQQVASIGLLNAIERFHPDRGTAFSSFAVPTILGEIKRYFRDKGWTVRVPRELQERALAVEQLSDELERELGRPPTVMEIAGRLQTTAEHVLEARAAAHAHHGVSLDRARDDDDDQAPADALGCLDEGYQRAEAEATFDELLAGLDERQRLVLELRFRHDLTQAEIGAHLGLSQMHVSRLIRQAIDELRLSVDPIIPSV